MAKGGDWTEQRVAELAPDERSIPAAREVLKKGGFGTVEATADGRGWWVVCRGLTDTYQVSARHNDEGGFDCDCTCPSPKYPCKHALALLLYLAQHPELRAEAEAPKAAATDFEALVRAVFRNPEEDTPRLVFADFLEENGQSDRAALIRYKCELAREKPNTRRHRELVKLLEPLWAKVRDSIEPLPEGVTCFCERGFLRVACDLSFLGEIGSLPARFTNLFRDGWVETLEATFYYDGVAEGVGELLGLVGELDVSRARQTEEIMVQLVVDTSEAMAGGRLARVKVHRNDRTAYEALVKARRGEAVAPVGSTESTRYHHGLTPQTLDLLARAGRLSGARHLSLGGLYGRPLGDAEVPTLLSADLAVLETLHLEGWHLTRDGVAALAEGIPFRLRSLVFFNCAFGVGGIAALASSTGLRGLETLRLSQCSLTDADALALANSKALPNLTHLDLRMNEGITARGGAAILASKNFPRLTGLDLHDCDIDPKDLLPLVLDAPDRPDLTVSFTETSVTRRLHDAEVVVELAAGTLRYAGSLGGLAACAGARRVTQFSAPRLDLDASDMPALAAGFDPETLRVLDLTDNRLKNDGAAALARAFGKFKLTELTLSRCRIQSAGVEALIESPLVNTLRVLDLSSNNIGKAGASALVKADVPPALEKLILTDCRLGEDEKRQLKAKFGAKVKL
jgi:uncharacterized protein (TIGR02996 family)